MSIKTMFLNALSGEPTPEIQRQAYSYAVRAKDTDMLVRLVRVKDLDPELEAELGKRSEIEVISGWLNRDGRTREEVVDRLKGERRATLLTDLACESGLPEETYAHLFSSGSVQVSWELLVNSSVPRPMRLACARKLASGFTLRTHAADDRLKPIGTIDFGLWSEFVSHMRNGYALCRIVSMPSLGMGDFKAACVVAQAAADTVFASNSDDNRIDGFHAATSLLDRVENLDLEQLEALDAIMKPAWSSSSVHASGACSNEYARRRARLMHDLPAALDEVRSAPSAAELLRRSRNLRQEMQDMGYPFRVVADKVGPAVLACSHVTADRLREERSSLDQGLARQIAQVALDREDRVLALEVLNMARLVRLDLTSELYAASDDPPALLEWLIGEDPPPPAILDAQVVRSDVELSLSMLPASSTMANPALVRNIAQELEAEFGDQASKWEAFVSLSGEWTGSFRALVRAVNSF